MSKAGRTISVKAAAYVRMLAAAKERGISVAELVRRACAAILEPAP